MGRTLWLMGGSVASEWLGKRGEARLTSGWVDG